ncbi:MAG: efflux RND transporter periplasmic adaptor subunit [Oceanococcus sp.]
MTTNTVFYRQAWFFGLLIAAILGGSFLLSRFFLNNPPTAQRQAHERSARLVEAQAVHPEAARVNVDGYGPIEAAQTTTLASRVGGEIIELAPGFTPGARVSKGQWLIRIDPSDYKLAVNEAQAALAAAKAALNQEKGQQAVARADAKMLGLKVSKEESQLMLRQPQLASAQAQVDSAAAGLARAQFNLERTEVLAPFDGYVLSREVSLGSQLASNGAIGKIAAATPYWVTVRLPVDSLKWLQWPNEAQKNASQVTLIDAAEPAGPRWQGRVIQLLPGLETEGRRAGVLVQIDDPFSGERPLLLGTYVQASIHGRALENAFRLDTNWVHEGQVWVVEQGQLRSKSVEISYQASDHVLVSSGLTDGDRVVTSVPSGFVEGMKVRLEAPAPSSRP